MKSRTIRALGVVATSVALYACVDTSPLDYVAPSEPEAGPLVTLDAAALDGNAPWSACEECLTGEGAPCRPEWDACAQITDCPELITCVLEHDCFSFNFIDDRIECAQPCFTEFGITTGVEPVLEGVLPINICTQNECHDACVRR
jgi:hypothetical protein